MILRINENVDNNILMLNFIITKHESQKWILKNEKKMLDIKHSKKINRKGTRITQM